MPLQDSPSDVFTADDAAGQSRQTAAPRARAGFGGGPHVERVFAVLRDGVWSGAIRRGEPLRERDLQETLGIGRTHLRDALKHLGNKGLLYTAPGRRGVMITTYTRQQILDFYTVREFLEGTAARLAAQHATARDIAAMREAMDRHDKAVEPIEVGLSNNLFHRVINRAANNLFLLDTLINLEDTLSLIRDPRFSPRERHISTVREHYVLVDAIEQRDAEGAEHIARLHVRNALAARLRRLAAE